MPGSLNKCIFIGNIVTEPELKMTPNGTPVCTFSMALNDDYKNANGEKVKQSYFISCKIMGKRAEVLHKYAHKGELINIDASYSYRDYEKNGAKNRFHEFKINDFCLIGRIEKRGASSNNSGGGASDDPFGGGAPSGAGADDDIPF